VAALAVAAVAAVVTFTRLGVPDEVTFDEVYYVADARDLLATGSESSFAVHPPLGKWVVAAGITSVGDTPTGWRSGGALLSVLAVAATVDLARRLTGRTAAGVVAGLLVVLDGVWLTVARLAMLDSVLAALVTFGTWALVVDHQRATARATDVPSAAPDAPPSAPAVSRGPLVAAGVLFGLAAATKWSGVLALGGAGLLAAGWEVAARRRRGGVRGGRTLTGAAIPVAIALVVVPVAVYALTWIPWVGGYASTTVARDDCPVAGEVDPACDPRLADRLRGLGRHHLAVARFHGRLDAEHPYRASATTWPAQLRPVVAHYRSCDDAGRDQQGEPCAPAGRASEVAVLGNPALWWSGLLLVPLAAAALRRRDGAAVVPLVLLGAQFLPWTVVARPVFSFYTASLVPVLATAVVVACVELDRPARRGVTLAIGASTAALAGGAVLLVSTGAAAVTAALVAGTLGVATGSEVDRRREERRGGPSVTRRLGTVTALAVLTGAAVVAVYLAPLWLAIPVEEEALRRRWWLRSWV
jgi:dolichyl-phosphate-mannose-protein mannosyltransferase